MSTKLTSSPYILLSQTAVSTTFTTPVTSVLHRDNIAYEISWSNGASTPLGTFVVQVRNHSTDPWVNLDFGAPISLSGNSGSHAINITQLAFSDMQIVYTPTQGSADIVISIVSKKIGG